MSQTLQPLSAWPVAARRAIIGVFTDIDDTLTEAGAITPEALQALADCSRVGLPVLAITGRPVGWSEPFARTWPVTAIVAENGAVALCPDRRGQPVGLKKIYQQDAATRAQQLVQLQGVAQRILQSVPGSQLARDSAGRETDIAIDHSEFSHLSPAQIDQVVQLMQAAGLHASVSSIHINGWLGQHDKWQGAQWIVQQLWQRDLAGEADRWVYVGDSTNDQLMFAALPNSFGVANIDRFVAQLHSRPRYLTSAARGAGFAQVVEALLQRQTLR